jgi:hypothetical protein
VQCNTAALGPQAFKKLMFDGGWLSVDDAAKAGLVNAVLAPAQLLPTAMAAAEKWAKGSEEALRLTKLNANGVTRASLAATIDAENKAFQVRSTTRACFCQSFTRLSFPYIRSITLASVNQFTRLWYIPNAHFSYFVPFFGPSPYYQECLESDYFKMAMAKFMADRSKSKKPKKAKL